MSIQKYDIKLANIFEKDFYVDVFLKIHNK